jgi:hypothetical protein
MESSSRILRSASSKVSLPVAATAANAVQAKDIPDAVWGRVLDFLYFEDVVRCTSIDTYFRNHITAVISVLLISNSRTFRIPMSVLNRFTHVTEVYVYTLIKERNPDHYIDHKVLKDRIYKESTDPLMSMWMAHMMAVHMQPPLFHLDQVTLNDVIPFLSKLPGVKCVYLGGLCAGDQDACWQGDGISVVCTRIDLSFKPGMKFDNFSEDDGMEVYKLFLRKCCEAYSSGTLPHSLHFDNVVPGQFCEYTGRACAWRDESSPSPSPLSPASIACPTCQLLCQSFPIDQTMSMGTHCLPCYSHEEIMEILKMRDPSEFHRNVNETFVQESKRLCGTMADKPKEIAAFYLEETIGKMDALIQHGADVHDPRVRHHLVSGTGNEDVDLGFEDGNPKRLFLLSSFQSLLRLGIDISAEDFRLCERSVKKSADESADKSTDED